MGDKNRFILLRAPLTYLNKYCKVYERFAAVGANGMLDSFYVTLELQYSTLNSAGPSGRAV
jgi:hypothetical protein